MGQGYPGVRHRLGNVNRLVALAMPAGPGWLEELQRIHDAGDAVLPVDLRLAPPQRARLLVAMRPDAVVTGPGERSMLGDGLPVEAGDAFVMATSGTTGEPKGVVLTHGAVAASAEAVNARLGVEPSSDRWWACLPLAHVGGLSVVTRALWAGVEVEVVEGFSVEGAVTALAGGATLTSLVPTALGRLEPAVAAQFRRIVLGGQAPPSSLPPNVHATYGMTETGSGVVYDGMPLDGVEVRIQQDDSGTGEIQLRGPMLLRAYRDGTDPKDEHGWLSTGDSGELAPDGTLTVSGRIGDLIISGGENLWPAAIERVLELHPAVRHAAVCGRPDPEWGERVTAFVVVRPNARADAPDPGRLLEELRELVRSELAPFAAPRELVIVAELPATSLGKVRRTALAGLDGPSASY
jgi:O-succinylbenzoic acid--CoA ligase